MEARGQSEGIFVFWGNRVLDLIEMENGAFSVSCCLKNCEDNFVWMFTRVYGPGLTDEGGNFWNELSDIRSLWNDPWCVGGDFNAVKFPEKRRNCQRISTSMSHFSEIIEDLEVIDLPLIGGSFTWCGGLNNRLASRLDHFLVSEDWENQFSGLLQSILPKPVSNHGPILLDCGGIKKGKAPFKFENMWLKVEGFRELVRSW